MLPRMGERRFEPFLLPLLVVFAGFTTILWTPACWIYHVIAVLLEIRLLLFVLFIKTAETSRAGAERLPSTLPYFTLIIPCRNESTVICRTIETLCRAIKYPFDHYRIVVMDDHSTDDSFVRLMKWKKMTTLPLPDCLVLKRPVHNKGGGKSGAMNAALRKIFFEREENAVIPAGKRHIIGFLDADVRCDPGILAVVADYFARPSVAALQVCKKPIISGPMSLLECCQTADYLADIFLSRQKHFRIPGRSSLRGNGMFFDGALLFHSTFVLDFQKRTYFNEETTGDDVDMTCRLKVAGLEIHYVDLVSVYEELAPTWRALLIQRARWIYGGYRRYIDFFGSLPQLWWRDPDELVEFVVLLAPLFFLAQLVPVLWLRKSFRVFLHFFALLLWGMGLMYRACSDVRIALIGFVFSLHRVMLILWATIFCVLRPTKPLEYWKTARRLDLTGNVR